MHEKCIILRSEWTYGNRSILLENLDLQKIEVDGFHKIILREACLGIALEVGDGFVKPDRSAQVKLLTGLCQGMKNLMGSGIIAGIFDADILQHMCVLKGFCP